MRNAAAHDARMSVVQVLHTLQILYMEGHTNLLLLGRRVGADLATKRLHARGQA